MNIKKKPLFRQYICSLFITAKENTYMAEREIQKFQKNITNILLVECDRKIMNKGKKKV